MRFVAFLLLFFMISIAEKKHAFSISTNSTCQSLDGNRVYPYRFLGAAELYSADVIVYVGRNLPVSDFIIVPVENQALADIKIIDNLRGADLQICKLPSWDLTSRVGNIAITNLFAGSHVTISIQSAPPIYAPQRHYKVFVGEDSESKFSDIEAYGFVGALWYLNTKK